MLHLAERVGMGSDKRCNLYSYGFAHLECPLYRTIRRCPLRSLFQEWPIPSALIHYFNNRKSELALQTFIVSSFEHLPRNFILTLNRLSKPPVPPPPHTYDREATDTDILTALWRLIRLPNFAVRYYETLLKAMSNLQLSPLTFSIIVVLRTRLLSCLWTDLPTTFGHSLLPIETATPLPDDLLASADISQYNSLWNSRVLEAQFTHLTDFIHGFSPEFVPYRAPETIQCIGGIILTLNSAIHEVHQLRFADGMQKMVTANSPHFDVLDAVITCPMFDVYASASPDIHAWLEDSTARARMKDALTEYSHMLPSSTSFELSPTLIRVQAILRGLESLHPN